MGLARSSLGLASLVVGLVGLMSFKLFPLLCIPLCLVGIVLAIMARKESTIVLPILGGTFSLAGLAGMTLLMVMAGYSINYVNTIQTFH
jgi:hypothetical protein